VQPEPHTKSLRNKNKKKQIQQKETNPPKTARQRMHFMLGPSGEHWSSYV